MQAAVNLRSTKPGQLTYISKKLMLFDAKTGKGERHPELTWRYNVSGVNLTTPRRTTFITRSELSTNVTLK